MRSDNGGKLSFDTCVIKLRREIIVGDTITARPILAQTQFSLLCFLLVFFVLPRYGSVAVMAGCASALTALVAMTPESFRSRNGSMVTAACLVGALWVAAGLIAGLTLMVWIQG